jgi:hypothetical protein
VISITVRWYLRYGLSYRDVQELLAERGVTVDHVTIYRSVQRFTREFIEAARPCRHAPGDRWFADETYLKVAGKWTYLYRAVDQHCQVIDVLLSANRDWRPRGASSPGRCTRARSRPRSPPTARPPPGRCAAWAWSHWRRRHQHRAKTCHYQRRKATYHEVLLEY